MLVTIAKEPILTEANIIAARVIESEGGYALEIKFDESGTWCLEQFTAANPGKHLVIFGQWGATMADGRWLGAPLITHRIGNGVLSFTPDASREEADQLVLGLNPTPQEITKNPAPPVPTPMIFSAVSRIFLAALLFRCVGICARKRRFNSPRPTTLCMKPATN